MEFFVSSYRLEIAYNVLSTYISAQNLHVAAVVVIDNESIGYTISEFLLICKSNSKFNQNLVAGKIWDGMVWDFNKIYHGIVCSCDVPYHPII